MLCLEHIGTHTVDLRTGWLYVDKNGINKSYRLLNKPITKWYVIEYNSNNTVTNAIGGMIAFNPRFYRQIIVNLLSKRISICHQQE